MTFGAEKFGSDTFGAGGTAPVTLLQIRSFSGGRTYQKSRAFLAPLMASSGSSRARSRMSGALYAHSHSAAQGTGAATAALTLAASVISRAGARSLLLSHALHELDSVIRSAGAGRGALVPRTFLTALFKSTASTGNARSEITPHILTAVSLQSFGRGDTWAFPSLHTISNVLSMGAAFSTLGRLSIVRPRIISRAVSATTLALIGAGTISSVSHSASRTGLFATLGHIPALLASSSAGRARLAYKQVLLEAMWSGGDGHTRHKISLVTALHHSSRGALGSRLAFILHTYLPTPLRSFATGRGQIGWTIDVPGLLHSFGAARAAPRLGLRMFRAIASSSAGATRHGALLGRELYLYLRSRGVSTSVSASDFLLPPSGLGARVLVTHAALSVAPTASPSTPWLPDGTLLPLLPATGFGSSAALPPYGMAIPTPQITPLPAIREGDTDSRYFDCTPLLAGAGDRFDGIASVQLSISRLDRLLMTGADLAVAANPPYQPGLDASGGIPTLWLHAPLGSAGISYHLVLSTAATAQGRTLLTDWSITVLPSLG